MTYDNVANLLEFKLKIDTSHSMWKVSSINCEDEYCMELSDALQSVDNRTRNGAVKVSIQYVKLTGRN